MTQDIFFDQLLSSAPDYFDRKTASRLLGGAIAPQTLANLESQGRGCQTKRTIGRKVVYEKRGFIAWLSSRHQSTDTRRQPTVQHHKKAQPEEGGKNE